MENFFLATVFLFSLGVFIVGCHRDASPPKTGAASENTGCANKLDVVSREGSNKWRSEGAEVEKEVVRKIHEIHHVLSDRSGSSETFIIDICRKISELPDKERRLQCYQALVHDALGFDFKSIGDAHATELPERNDVCRRLSFAYSSLEFLVNEIHDRQWSVNAPLNEQFEPLFLYAEKMKQESLRVGEESCGYPKVIKRVERLYGYSLKSRKCSPKEKAWFMKKFTSLTGRKPRTLEEEDQDLKKGETGRN